MRILYVVERPELSGGIRVVFQHARLLCELGHQVTVAGHGALPAWPGFRGNYHDLDHGPPKGRRDLVVATYFSTLPKVRQLDLGPLAHFCQGYEGDFPHLQPARADVEAVYSWPVPTLVVSPHLGRLVAERFGRHWRLAPPAVFPPPWPRWPRPKRPRRLPWVVLPGVFESEPKGVPSGLAAVRRLRESGQPCRLLRISALPLTREQPPPDQALVGVKPERAARAMGSCDLMLFPVTGLEGFGLPLLEAMALGVPVVASDGPATRYVSGGEVTLVPPEQLAEGAAVLLSDAAAWNQAQLRGLERARAFRPELVAQQLEEALEWAIQTAPNL